MKSRVIVTLKAECEVEILVEHGPDDDPTDLSNAEQNEAISKAESWPGWEFDSAREAT